MYSSATTLTEAPCDGHPDAPDEGAQASLTQVRSEQTEDLALIGRVVARDRQAFAELYNRYHRRLSRFLWRFTRRYDIGEEIVNDTMWVVWCKASAFRGESLVSTWIMGIAYRRALNAFRRAALHERKSRLEIVDCEPTAADALQATEQQQMLRHALSKLPLEQRLVLEYAYYLDHSCEEIAAIMGSPVNTVKTRMFHARRKLREMLQKVDGIDRDDVRGRRVAAS